MKTTKLHTFEEILDQGIFVDGSESPTPVSCLFIPKIQRSYAQGRKGEKEIRKDFLDDIFSTLTSETNDILELSFLFGSKQPLSNGSTEGFELLDGQQRATTLFLLYWYINQRENEQLPNFLNNFTYETRDTSTVFLNKIARKNFSFSNQKPSEVLRANIWFTDDFNCDPTICAMLNMLDDIHARYNNLENRKLADKLSRLKFYVLMLEDFDMNDELYIKMNSRGLSLIPFENFKASVVRYMKKHSWQIYGGDKSVNGELPYWLNFISKIDAKWIDLFWENPLPADEQPVSGEIQIDDREIGNRYFRFFNRYFFTKASLLYGVLNKKAHPLASFFYKDWEESETEQRFKGWENYKELFEKIEETQQNSYSVFGSIERIFDIYMTHHDFIVESIQADPYGNTNKFDVLSKDQYTLNDRVVFAALTEFIEALPDDDDFKNNEIQANFKRMLRVVHNVIENTVFEAEVATIGVINAISEIIHFPGATSENFHKSLANNELKSRNAQLQDEQEKCKEMFDENGVFDASWEIAYKNAEKHPFFKGSVTFFFTPKAGNSQAFTDRYNIIKDLFDEKGITDYYRDNEHILIRALLSCHNQWNRSGMENRYFTEKAEKNKYLKMLLTGNTNVRDMFCKYFNNPNVTMIDYLKDAVENATLPPNEQNQSFKMLYNRLITDKNAPAIYDDVKERENKRGCFRIQNNRSYIIAIPGKWYDQLVLDTERHLIIPDIIQKYGFSYKYDGHKQEIEGPLQDFWWWVVELLKDIYIEDVKYTIQIIFDEYKYCRFYVFSENVSRLEDLFGITQNTIKDGIKIPGSIQYQFYEGRQVIFDKIEEIENRFKEIVS